MNRIRTRFAPSPTGYMHIGNLRTALYEYAIAKHAKGDFIVRIEDTDQARYVEGAVDVIFDTLKAVGLFHDEGMDVGGAYGPYVQSQRKALYMQYAKELVERKGAYYCFCRQGAEGEKANMHMPDPCKHLSASEIAARLQDSTPHAIRQCIPSVGTTTFVDEVYGSITVENSGLDEGILMKRDGYPTYNFANVVDDHLMHITHVVRGNEYLSSTPKYNLLYEAFGWEIPHYVHVPPVMKNEHEKLSKRNGDASFQQLAEQGFLPQAILNYIALLGWCPASEQELFTLEELCEQFEVSRINTSPAIFDIEKLRWMNGEYIRRMSEEAFLEKALPHFKQGVKTPVDVQLLVKLMQPRTVIFSDIVEALDFIDVPKIYTTDIYENKKMKTSPDIALSALQACIEPLSSLEVWTYDTLYTCCTTLAAALGLKNGQIMYPLRIALSGKQFTPGGAVEIAEILGKDNTLHRMKVAVAILEVEKS